MAAGGGDFQRALRRFLALDIGEVGEQVAGFGDAGLGARQHLHAAEMIGDGDQAARREDRHVAARPRRFRSGSRRADDAARAALAAIAAGSTPATGGDGAVEGQFAERDEVAELVAGDGADRRHQRQRDRQIVVAAFLGQVGGREVDDDALRRQRQAGGMERAAHALAALGDRLVGQADDDEVRQARRDLHLHVDRDRLDALKRNGGDVRNHAPKRRTRRPARFPRHEMRVVVRWVAGPDWRRITIPRAANRSRPSPRSWLPPSQWSSRSRLSQRRSRSQLRLSLLARRHRWPSPGSRAQARGTVTE